MFGMTSPATGPSPSPRSGRTPGFWLATVAILAWIGFVGYRAWQGWPHVPMDISAADAATQAAFNEAISAHVVRHLAMALLPPAVLLLLLRLIIAKPR